VSTIKLTHPAAQPTSRTPARTTHSFGKSGRTFAIAILGAPAALLLAAVLHPPHGASAESWLAASSTGGVRFYLAHLLFLVGAVLLVPAARGMAAALPAERAHRGGLAATLTALGALGIANLVGMDFLVWRMANGGADQSEMLVVLRDIATNPAVMGPAFALTGLGGLGVALLATELRRAGVIATVPAALIAAGPLLYFALPLKPLSVVGALLLLAGMCSVGWPLVRGSAGSVSFTLTRESRRHPGEPVRGHAT
jgi:hypothetical protein